MELRKVRDVLDFQRRQHHGLQDLTTDKKKGEERASHRRSAIALREADARTDNMPSARRSVAIQYVVHYLDLEVQGSELYADMLLYWPFLILFLVFFLWGRDITANHMAAAAVSQSYLEYPFKSSEANSIIAEGALERDEVPLIDGDRKFMEISRAQHWHDWFTDVLIPQTWDCQAPKYSRQTLSKRGQLTYIGAMQLRVLIMRNDSCSMKNTEFDVPGLPAPMECYDKHGTDGEEKRPLCNQLNPGNLVQPMWRYKEWKEVDDGIYTTAANGAYHAGGYTVEFPFNTTCEMMLEFASLIASNDPECNIIDDRRTRFVIVEWFEYSTNSDTFLVSKLIQEVSPGGGWTGAYQIRMFPAWTMKRLNSSIFDCVFLLFVLYFFFQLVRDWVRFYRRTKKILAFCFDMWNIIEVVNISTLVAVFVLRWVWFSRSRGSSISFPFAPAYPHALDLIALTFSMMIYANSLNVVLTFLKLLKYLQLNTRMNVLTRTMEVAAENIFGVLVLFVFVVTGFAMSFFSLYGANSKYFRNINTSFSSLLFLILGQSRFNEMKAIQPDLTGLVYALYVILSQFLLLNFIIAILCGSFGDVMSDSALEPLDQSLLHFFERLRYVFDPRNIKSILELKLKKKKRSDLIAEVSKYLKEVMTRIEKDSPEMLDSDYPMHRADLKRWIPEGLRRDLTDFYIMLLWDDIVHQYQVEQSSEDVHVRQNVEEAIMVGTQRAIGATLNGVDEFNAQVTGIEEAIQRLVLCRMREGHGRLREDAPVPHFEY